MFKKITFQACLAALLLLQAFVHETEAQPLSDLNMEMFKLPNGEPGNHVQAIVQDHYGFMWFGSQYGLHRWDGHQFKTYLHDPKDPQSISSDYVECILVAKDGSLWLGTWGGGLNHFRHETGQFVRYPVGNEPGKISHPAISALTEDRDGNIWIGTLDGLDRLDPRTGRVTTFRHRRGDASSLSCNQVRSLYVDRHGTLWAGAGFPFDNSNCGGLNRYHPETESFTRYLHDPHDPTSLAGTKVRALFEDTKGNFWVGTSGDGLQQMNRTTGDFIRYPRTGEPSAPYVRRGDFKHTTFVFEDKKHRLWTGDFAGGIKCYDPATGKSRHFKYEKGDPQGLLENAAWTAFQSKDGVLWFSTASENARVYRVVQKKDIVSSVHLPAKQGKVQSFTQDKLDNLWFTTDTFSMGKMERQPGCKDLHVEYAPREEALNHASKILAAKDGTLWVVKNEGNAGLLNYDPRTEAIRRFLHDPNDGSSIAAGAVNDILADERGNLWIATASSGLDFFEKKTGKFKHFKSQSGSPNSLPHNHLDKLFLDPQGMLWIVGSSDLKKKRALFISRFDPEKNHFTRFNLNDIPQDNNLWQSPPAQDRQGNIWVCLDHGILKLTPTTGRCTFFDSNQLGKYATPLKGMTMDDEGMLWVMGNRLLKFDPEREAAFDFNVRDGLDWGAFQQGAIFKNNLGEIFLGGHYGFSFFNPKDLRDSTKPAPVVRLTDFELLDQTEQAAFDSTQQAAFWQSGTLELKHDQNVFAFRFAIMDFTDPNGNRLEYMLENFDENWRVAGQEPRATYIKVPPGSYRFRVRGANSLGVWGEETSLQVIVCPPWWATWWAWTAYTLLALGLLFGSYRFHLNRRLEQAETRRLKELDVLKNRLYANITHEFRTPLTIILGMAKQVKENPGEWFGEGVDMIARNGENLLCLVNQMLELSKLESGHLPLNNIRGDVLGYLNYLVESFHSFAGSRGIQLHFLSNTDSLTMDYDPEKLQQVVANLLSNAVKFTPENGHVYCSVDTVPGPNAGTPASLVIKIKDTGAGIPEEHLPRIFDRFYQVDPDSYRDAARQAGGTGIGLALARELVLLMGGAISVKSREGKGTAFTVTLPVRQEAALSDEIPVAKQENHFENLVPAQVSQPAAVVAGPEENGNRPLVLIAEDNADVVAYLASCLREKYRIAVAKDGREAVDLATDLVPDLVISDVMMPHRDGYEVCKILKNDERTSHIPIVMLTAKADLDSKLEGLEHGADAYLAKPFYKKELLLRIRKLLELRQALQERYRSLAGEADDQSGLAVAVPVSNLEDFFVKKIRRIVEAHLDDFDFNVARLCREAGMSHSQLHRKLSALTGLPATKFIRHVRLFRAKELLRDPELTITAVAFDTGFNDPSYFGRVFKQEFGRTPLEWREMTESVEEATVL